MRKPLGFTMNLMIDASDVATQFAEACTVEELIEFVREISDALDDPDFDSRLYDLATESLDLDVDDEVSE